MPRTIILQLDELDYSAVQKAVAHRQTFRSWPSASEDDCDPFGDGSNVAGLAIAEICRGWLEMLNWKPDVDIGGEG